MQTYPTIPSVRNAALAALPRSRITTVKIHLLLVHMNGGFASPQRFLLFSAAAAAADGWSSGGGSTSTSSAGDGGSVLLSSGPSVAFFFCCCDIVVFDASGGRVRRRVGWHEIKWQWLLA